MSVSFTDKPLNLTYREPCDGVPTVKRVADSGPWAAYVWCSKCKFYQHERLLACWDHMPFDDDAPETKELLGL